MGIVRMSKFGQNDKNNGGLFDRHLCLIFIG